MLLQDPLKIFYIIALATDDPFEVTPFQAFSNSWKYQHWTLGLLPLLPGDILERTYDIDSVVSQRMGGMRPLIWIPLNIASLERTNIQNLGAFVVVFTGEPECATRVSAWSEKQAAPILHISTENADNVLSSEEFNIDKLESYCKEAFAHSIELFSPERKEAAEAALGHWKIPRTISTGLKALGHNVVIPNTMLACPLKSGPP